LFSKRYKKIEVFLVNNMKKLTEYKILTVYCKCGEKLVQYKKGPGRRLLKIHRDRITKDFCGIFLDDYSSKDSEILCSKCNCRIATVKCINGKYVNKLNQGQIGEIK
jgi:hypothetical protein